MSVDRDTDEGRPARNIAPREPRAPSSRVIDRVTDALGHERTFVAICLVVAVLALAGVLVGGLTLVSSLLSLLTFVMVFAIQHTSSRESRALNVKLDELIRATDARNDLIGAEAESHDRLDRHRQELLAERTE